VEQLPTPALPSPPARFERAVLVVSQGRTFAEHTGWALRDPRNPFWVDFIPLGAWPGRPEAGLVSFPACRVQRLEWLPDPAEYEDPFADYDLSEAP
jgi:hypothetical protein